MKYRPEIDGLRAVALVPVIVFHTGLPGLGGGFVGVDVFFVVSGYLITSIIYAEIAEERFSVARFYERRIRRLLPALVLVSVCCIPPAVFLMFPADFIAFGRSLVASQLFVSNILFWQESSYFASNAELKPLLHTWSLSIEEQFYIVFPLLLILLRSWSARWLALALGLGCLASLAIAEWASTRYASANFYLLPSRAWELTVGALIAILWGAEAPGSRATRQVVAGAGLVAVLAAILLFDEATSFPGLWAGIPVLGTAAILLAARRDTLVGALLSHRLPVGIGLISYSAYLWHQPLLAFLRLGSLAEPGPGPLGMIVLATFVLAWLTWKYVETPFRRRPNIDAARLFRLAPMAIASVAAAGLVIALTPDLNHRPLRMVYPHLDTFAGYDPDDRAGFEALTAHYRRGTCFLTPDLRIYDDAACLTYDAARPDYLLMGDSNAAHLWFALQERHPGINLLQATSTACRPLADAPGAAHCTRLRDRMLALARSDDRIEGVVLSAVWRESEIDHLAATVRELRAAGLDVVVLGPGIAYRRPAFRMLQMIPSDDPTVRAARMRDALHDDRFALTETLQAIVTEAGGRFVPLLPRICPDDACPVFASDGMLFIIDGGHYTLGGARDAVALINVFPAAPDALTERSGGNERPAGPRAASGNLQ